MKAANSAQASKERAFHVHMLVESVCILSKNECFDTASAPALFLTC